MSVAGGLFSFLRKSNFTVPSARASDLSKHLTRNGIKFFRSGAVLRIRCSKTLQHSEGILQIPLPLIPTSDFCPFTAIHHFQLVQADANPPFFCVPQGSLPQPITFSLFSTFLKETITAIGLDATNFSLRSLRRGGATHAYQSGVPDHVIKLHGLIPKSKIVLTPPGASNPLPPLPPYHLA